MQDVVFLHIYIYLFIFGSLPNVGYDTVLSSLLLKFRWSLLIIYIPNVRIFNLIFIFYHSKLDYNVLFALGVRALVVVACVL